VQILPVISLVYAFFAVVILFFGLLVTDKISRFDQFQEEVEMQLRMRGLGLSMRESLLTGRFVNPDYPFLAVKGRDAIREEHPKILVVGDSFVFGSGLTNINQIWWTILQSELNQRGYDCAVYAAGLGGASTWDELLWLRDTALLEDIKPDLVIIGFVTNDMILDSRYLKKGLLSSFYNKIDQSIESQKNKHYVDRGWISEIFPNLNAVIDYKLASRNGAYSAYEDLDEFLAGNEHLEYCKTLLFQPLGEFVKHAGIPVVVIPTPESPRGRDFELLYENVLPLFEQAGLPVHNPLDRFRDRYPKPNRQVDKYFMAMPTDYHPGPATSWFLGEYAADVLEREYPSILGAKGNRDKSKLTIEINDWMPYMLEPRVIQESGSASQYTIEYPDQTLEADMKRWININFLTYPLGKKYVKLSFKHPVKLSSIQIESEYLLSAEVNTLGLNLDLGFDDQKPISLGKRRSSSCTWEDASDRYVTSLLISAVTKDGRQAPLTITIESDGGEEAFY